MAESNDAARRDVLRVPDHPPGGVATHAAQGADHHLSPEELLRVAIARQ